MPLYYLPDSNEVIESDFAPKINRELIEPGDRIQFHFVLEYVAVSEVVFDGESLDAITDIAWEKRAEADPVIGLQDCNIVREFAVVRKKGE
jgi:hypothetical protein